MMFKSGEKLPKVPVKIEVERQYDSGWKVYGSMTVFPEFSGKSLVITDLKREILFFLRRSAAETAYYKIGEVKYFYAASGPRDPELWLVSESNEGNRP